MEKTFQIKTKIREERKKDFERWIKKANKRAKKLGLTPLTVEYGEPVEIIENEATGRVRVVCPVTVIGEAPRLEGWAFKATIDFKWDSKGNRKNFVFSAPNVETKKEWWKAPPCCEHCNKNRRRKKTFILEKDGREMQVGSTCIKDFLGVDCNPEAAAQFACDIMQLKEEDLFEYETSSIPPRWKVEIVLEVACAHCRIDGYISRAAASINDSFPTSSHVWEHLGVVEKGEKIGREYTPTKEDKEKAKRVKQYVLGIIPRNGYERNLKNSIEVAVNSKTVGLVVSAVSSYDRATEHEIKRKIQEKARSQSKHFGTVGKREEYTLTVTGIKGFEGDYGWVSVIRLIDATGNIATWFYSGRNEFETGRTYTGKCTVKKHDEYRGTAQTILSRCNLELVTK